MANLKSSTLSHRQLQQLQNNEGQSRIIRQFTKLLNNSTLTLIFGQLFSGSGSRASGRDGFFLERQRDVVVDAELVVFEHMLRGEDLVGAVLALVGRVLQAVGEG